MTGLFQPKALFFKDNSSEIPLQQKVLFLLLEGSYTYVQQTIWRAHSTTQCSGTLSPCWQHIYPEQQRSVQTASFHSTLQHIFIQLCLIIQRRRPRVNKRAGKRLSTDGKLMTSQFVTIWTQCRFLRNKCEILVRLLTKQTRHLHSQLCYVQ